MMARLRCTVVPMTLSTFQATESVPKKSRAPYCATRHCARTPRSVTLLSSAHRTMKKAKRRLHSWSRLLGASFPMTILQDCSLWCDQRKEQPQYPLTSSLSLLSPRPDRVSTCDGPCDRSFSISLSVISRHSRIPNPSRKSVTLSHSGKTLVA